MYNFLTKALHKFPPGIEYAFAYGSGVFQQRNSRPTKENMADLIFVVKDPKIWHAANLQTHPDHYSFLQSFGPDFIASLQCNYGAKVYFNTLVKFEERMIKYGVISKKDFVDDMERWTSLYVSGRLHKPVLTIKDSDDRTFDPLIYSNLTNAINTSLLMLPEKFQEIDLYVAITGLSYLGDFRMIFGEDKNKVKNIAMPNVEYFASLYKETLKESPFLTKSTTNYVQDVCPKARLELVKSLPLTLKNEIMKRGRVVDKPETALRSMLVNRDTFSNIVKKSVGSIVRKSSISQSLKGILTAGISKSVLYSLAKVDKMFKSLAK
eukprot:Seg1027.1 transcript_id=Seg1027.1/GoldUCD/mRNA.D3Y31 product="Phosphatidate cytidylyltransferase mitochondrial" protein_id=Seg1027.1/GoldUCD/D3Y31